MRTVIYAMLHAYAVATWAASAWALVASSLVVATPSSAQQPNVVLILGDDQAHGDFGFMGHAVVRTPHLDRLAAQGVLFPRGYVPTSLCRPSLASIITGRWPHHHGITGNDPQPGTDRQRMVERFAQNATLPLLLGKLGYRSLQTGKWWEGNYRVGGFNEGMTHGDPKRGGRHGDEGLKIGRETMQPIYDFIAASTADKKPFFVWYAPFLPHTPHNPPERLLSKYRKPGRSKFVARYYAMCEWFDETCGQLLNHLKEKDLEKDTLVVFVSDNGWIQKEDRGGFAPRSKRSPNEGGVRTPIILRWPGRLQPARRDVAVSSIDLAPTILAACGVQDPATMDGIDLLPLCRDARVGHGPVFGAAFTHDVVDLQNPASSLLARWVLADRDKLILRTAAGRAPELYDVVADPSEDTNLASRRPEAVPALRAEIAAWWQVPSPPRPNILFVLTDDQRNDMMGCAGHPILQTPNMDRLARQGVRFTNAFVTTSICAASRASILTGLHRRTHGFTFGTPPLAAGFTTRSYPRLLRSAGYRTGFVGKIGVRLTKGAANRMFDVFRPLSPPYAKRTKQGEPRHLTDITADAAIDFLRTSTKVADGEPFCLSVSFNAPHAEDANKAQYIWPKDLDGLYDDKEIPPPPLSSAEFFAAQPEFLRESLGRVRWHWRFDTDEKRGAMTRGYYRMITGVDRALGRILTALEDLGVAKNTVVIFTSDNGYFLGERGFAGKWLIYEPSIRVPMIVYDPRAKTSRRGIELAQVALNIDLPSTILDLAGVPEPPSWQGRSLLPLLRGDPATDGSNDAWRTDFFYEHLFANDRIPKSEGVRDERYTYVRYFEQKPPYEELFDRQEDPLQTQNLVGAPDRRAVLDRLRKRCDVLRGQYTPR